MKRPMTMEEHRAAGNIVKRYVVTHLNRHGARILTFACQGRYTYACVDDAIQACNELVRINIASVLSDVYGAQALGTFEVRECECWAGHFDPCGIWFD